MIALNFYNDSSLLFSEEIICSIKDLGINLVIKKCKKHLYRNC